ncbi:MAG: carbohydrate kinase family protein [Patescibacteria group bacterium]
MFDVITFGSATRDVFVYSKNFRILESEEFVTGRAFCFNLGSKIEVDKIIFTTGGGGTNTACGFSRLGLKSAVVSQIGNDPGGQIITEDLKKEKVNNRFLLKSEVFYTAYSIILSIPGSERTILVHRGASENIPYQDIPWEKLKAKWFYITSLGGDFMLLEKIFKTAWEKKIKVAINPGSKELERSYDLFPLIKKADILFLNQEEAAKLTGLSFKKPQEILKKLDEEIKGIVVMTCGAQGSMAAKDDKIYQAGILKVAVAERTGAGDAFGCGFLTDMILKNKIEDALQLGTANATSVIQKIGAKVGLLAKNDLVNFKKVEVKKLESGI